MLKSYKIYTTCTNGALGLHLSRAPWDPYPWVSSIQKDSSSYQAGLRIGDCLLELNGQDVLGMKISEIAGLLKNHWLNESSNHVNVVIWRNKCNNNNNNNNRNTKNANDICNNKNKIKNDGDQLHDDDDDGVEDNDDDDEDDDDEDEENNAHNINQQSLQKFATCLQHIAQLLECPVCLEVIKPPGWQCCNGHVLCNNCRSRSEKCPVCRVPLGPRGRCLLSDKLFTLLADSFPCDGVRSNKNSPKDRRKCSPEFHNQPKMAIMEKQRGEQHQQQQHDKEEQAAKKAKDFILTSLRQRRRRKLSSTKANNDEQHLNGGQQHKQQEPMVEQDKENSHSLRQKQAMYEGSIDVNNVVVSNRKSSADYNHREGVNVTTALTAMTSAIQQCHCATCFKPDKVAIVNNNNNSTGAATTTTTTTCENKYVLHVTHSHSECATTLLAPSHNNEEKFHNFHCPTGKLCCLMMKNKNVMLPPTTTATNNLSSAMVPLVKVNQLQQQQQQQLQQVNKISKRLNTEWDILAHLTVDHQLPVQQYYAEYGQRIHVQNLIRSQTLVCLNLKSLDTSFDTKLEKFFIACIPLDMYTNKVAIFVYHMNCATTNTTSSLSSTALNGGSSDEVSNFETIIENPLTGIKWFGRAHPLTTPWSVIKEKQHFLEHQVLNSQGLMASAVSGGGGRRAAESEASDEFVFVVKRK